MKKEVLVLILCILLLQLVFAAPTKAPPAIDTIESNSDDSMLEELAALDTASVTADSEQTSFFDKDSQETDSTIEDRVAIITTSEPESNNTPNLLLTLTFINTLALVILISAATLHIFQDKHPYLAFKFKKKPVEYTNTQDSVQYTETFNKLYQYIHNNLQSFPIESIKATLLQQGFTEKEIDAVYYEIQKK
jgi:hypothetical protein